MYGERKRFNEVLVPHVYDKIWESLITCGGVYALNNVEVTFEWIIDGTEVMQRYVKYHTREDFLRACVESRPHTIQLGGVLPGFQSHCPMDADRIGRERDNRLCKEGITSARGPLVIDIDLTDYNRVGVCQCGALKRCCNTCFEVFLDPATDVLDYLLRTVFGFTNMFSVWSGRRGVHIWVCDPNVVLWTREQRTTFIERIRAIRSTDECFEHIRNILQSAMDSPVRAALRERGDTLDDLFPKIDVEVSKSANHLKKLPMAIHQSTCVVCIPTPPANTGFRFRPDDHTRRPNDLSIDLVDVFAAPIKKALITKGAPQ